MLPKTNWSAADFIHGQIETTHTLSLINTPTGNSISKERVSRRSDFEKEGEGRILSIQNLAIKPLMCSLESESSESVSLIFDIREGLTSSVFKDWKRREKSLLENFQGDLPTKDILTPEQHWLKGKFQKQNVPLQEPKPWAIDLIPNSSDIAKWIVIDEAAQAARRKQKPKRRIKWIINRKKN